MANTFRIEIATPERLLVNESVTEATIPGEQGYLGILPGHAPLLSELGIGELSYTLVNGQRRHLAIRSGWVEVANDHVRVVAEGAEHASEIDAARAEASLKRAAERLSKPGSELDIARALNAMKRAQARLAASKSGSGER